jgi:DNA-binding transcriptional regulator YiaG
MSDRLAAPQEEAMTGRQKTRTQLDLPLNALAELAVPMPPSGGDKTFIVPPDWIGAPIQSRLASVLASVLTVVQQPEAEGATLARRGAALRAAVMADREAIVDLTSAVLARRLMSVAGKALPRTQRAAPKAWLAVARRLADNLLGDPAALDKVAGWIGVSVSAWADDDRAESQEVLARRIAYLVSTHAEDAAGSLVELLLPPNRPIEYLAGLLKAPDSLGSEGLLPQVPNGTLVVLASGRFHDIREALYKNTFQKVEGSPWPTAPLLRDGSRGYAQLRPPVMDSEPLLPASRLQAWVTTMWRQQSELSDLDADGLDALCAIYLGQARVADDAAVADVDEILAMRGLKPKRGGQGRRGGYEPEQRAEMLKALSHIQNLWIDIGEIKIYEQAGSGRGGRHSTIKTLQSRPFIITDRMGQVRLDGYLDVERFIFRPGKAFAAFLFGAGRETGLLFQKALQYDPVRRKWEKRLTRYTSWQWQAQARTGKFVQRFGVRALLDAVGETLNDRYPMKTRVRLEKALSTLEADGVLARWRYTDWEPDTADQRRWATAWLDAEIAIEAPTMIREYYERQWDEADVPPAEILAVEDVSARIRHHRKTLGVSQEEAARRLGIRQGHFSKLERGRVQPSGKLRDQIDIWLGE